MRSLHSRDQAHCRVLWRARRWSKPSTTDRWQDKGARGVLAVGRLISRGYGAKSHIARHLRSLRLLQLTLNFNRLVRCVGLLQ
jgi:hypothetical protein